MHIKEKISQDRGFLHLYKEGIFWVAYEQSAYCIWLQKKYKPTKKHVKAVGMGVVSVGFPDSALAGVTAACGARGSEAQQSNAYMVLPLEEDVDEKEFLQWKTWLPLAPTADSAMGMALESLLINRIAQLDLCHATPMDCFNFLAALKKDLQKSKENKLPINS